MSLSLLEFLLHLTFLSCCFLSQVGDPLSYHRESWMMEKDEKLQMVPTLHMQGNALVKQKQFREAASKYKEAVLLLKTVQSRVSRRRRKNGGMERIRGLPVHFLVFLFVFLCYVCLYFLGFWDMRFVFFHEEIRVSPSCFTISLLGGRVSKGARTGSSTEVSVMRVGVKMGAHWWKKHHCIGCAVVE